eukprot:scaffold46873_cov36-Cyclotella_meneghiniana.AAC.1
MKFSSTAAIIFATLSIASAKVGTKSTKSSDGKSTKTNKSSKTGPTSFPTTIGGDPAPGPGPVPPTPVTSSPSKEPITSPPSSAPVTSLPTKAPFTLSPTSAPTTAPVTCPSQPTCTNCIGYSCTVNDDCCYDNNCESCKTLKGVCQDDYASSSIVNCTMTCDPNNQTLAIEQCAGLGVPDAQIRCSDVESRYCIPGTFVHGECKHDSGCE